MRCTLLASCVFLVVSPAPGLADELRLEAKDLVARSVVRDLHLSPDGSVIELESGELFEDDGPAAGYSYLPNEERLSDKVWIRKELIIPSPAATKATLLVGSGGDLKALINGRPIDLKNPGKAGNYWQAYSIPPDCLKAGRNDIVLSGSGKVWIARSEDFAAGAIDRTKHPNRSARSGDAGKTWDYDKLGPAGTIDGEYYVRLFLERHRPAGSLVLPVLDAGNLAGRAMAPPLAKPIPFRASIDTHNGNVAMRVRTGTTTTPDPKNWSSWRELKSGAELRDPSGRFFQIAIDLSTDDPLSSPGLKTLRIESDPPKSADWFTKLRIVESTNADIVRSSIPFNYEPFDHPRLAELRTRHKLDDVAKGAQSELEMIERLARWASQCWDKGHLKDIYPAWDAHEILKPHADGRPIGGFCQQYNVVFLQACESFGISGRAVSIGVGDHGGKLRGSGHEVVELWSNQFQKWIYVDGNMAWYAVDVKSREPLSLWELRQRQLAAISEKPFAPIAVIHLREDGKRWTGLTDWPIFLEMRLIPRSNFLHARSPLPLHQGMRGWFWTGHQVWTDPEYPASLLYGQRVSDRRNWEWTLNQTHFQLEATPTPGELRVHLDTETPGFESFRADIDAAGWKPVASGFLWKLHPGKNRLEVRSRNSAGRDGIVSRMIVE